MVICLTAMLTSCAVAPVNSNYESARSLKKNNLEALGSFTYYGDNSFENYNNNLGLRLGYGITDNIDVKISYERYFPALEGYEDFSVNFFSIYPKVSFFHNTLAIKLPLNVYNYGDSEHDKENIFALNPTIIGTLPMSNQFEISRQGVTKHIKTLEEAGLVYIDSQGRERFCNANAKPLKELNKWIKFYEQFWNDKLGDLGNYLDNKA